MAKIGSMELIVILIVAMLAIGPERMPKAARTLGKAVGSFKKYMNVASSDLREDRYEFRVVTDEIADAQNPGRGGGKAEPQEEKEKARRAGNGRDGRGAQAAEGRSEGGGGRAAERKRNRSAAGGGRGKTR